MIAETPRAAVPSGAPPAISVADVVKRFGSVIAVDHLDLDVANGELVTLLGPNGAGKTTIVRMIATLELPDSGTVEVCGHDVATSGDEVRSRIALTGQFAALEDNLTASENLLLIAQLRGLRSKAAREVVDELIERFDIGEYRRKLTKRLSGGQRRRVDLAAGLVTRPDVLVLDEPTAGLDPRSRHVVWSTIRNLVADGVTVLLTTQYLEEANSLADRIVLIDHGRTVATGSPSELRSQIGDERVDIIAVDSAGFHQLAATLTAQFEVQSSPEQRTLSIPAPHRSADLARVAAAVDASGVPVEEIALRHPTLDDAFLALTSAADLTPGDETDGRQGTDGPTP